MTRQESYMFNIKKILYEKWENFWSYRKYNFYIWSLKNQKDLHVEKIFTSRSFKTNWRKSLKILFEFFRDSFLEI